MNPKSENSTKRLFYSLLRLYSVLIHSALFAAAFYVTSLIPGVEADAKTYIHLFCFVAALTVLHPLTFLLDFTMAAVYEVTHQKIPILIVRFISKLGQALALFGFIHVILLTMEEVTMSLMGQAIMGIMIFLLTEWMTKRKQK